MTLGFSFNSSAQIKTGDELRNNIESQRVALYTQRMNITPVEAQQFWPVYNEYLQQKNELSTSKRKLTRFYIQNSTTMTENDTDVIINKYILIAKSEAQLLEEYNKRFRKILPADKVIKLYLVEIEFKKILLEKIRDRSNKIIEEQDVSHPVINID
jgi:hypothetical protein